MAGRTLKIVSNCPMVLQPEVITDHSGDDWCYTTELRMAKTVPFAWETGVWYTAKMTVAIEGEKALVRGKIWPRDEPEPATWSIEAEDPLPNLAGSPGLYGYSPAEIFYDNIKVWQ